MKITHVVLLRFVPDFLSEEHVSYTAKLFAQLQNAIPEILTVSVYQNCVQRNGNYDLMIAMELSDTAALPVHLSHPLHIAFAESNRDYLLSRASFDYVPEN